LERRATAVDYPPHPDLSRPSPALNGLRIAHLSDVHAGIHMSEEKMREIVKQTNALGADLIVQTGDMIDISQSYIPDYVRAFRDLQAPLASSPCSAITIGTRARTPSFAV